MTSTDPTAIDEHDGKGAHAREKVAVTIEPANFPAASLPDERPAPEDLMTPEEFLKGVIERNRGIEAHI